MGGAGRLHAGFAHWQRDPERRRRQLPPLAQHDAVLAGQSERLLGCRAGRCRRYARTGTVGAAPLGRTGYRSARGLWQIRLPRRVPKAVHLCHDRSVGGVFRHPQRCAVLRCSQQPNPPLGPHRAGYSVPPLDHMACPDLGLYHGRSLAVPFPRRRQQLAPARLPRNAQSVAQPCAVDQVGGHPHRAACGDRRARGAAHRQGDRCQPRSRPRGACGRHGHSGSTALGRFC